MDEVIRFLKQHKRQILKYGKKVRALPPTAGIPACSADRY